MLSKTRKVVSECGRCLVLSLHSPPHLLLLLLPSTRISQQQQLRFLRHKTQANVQLYPDHLKKVILGASTRVDPSTRKIYLRDIEAIRARNLVRLKGFTKGRLYNASIHGKAEMIMEIMRAYDRQATQQLYAEAGIVRSVPLANFYLLRAYYILRNQGPWLRARMSRELVETFGRWDNPKRGTGQRWTRFLKFAAQSHDGDSGYLGDTSSTPFRVWDFNYRLFVKRLTCVTGSQHERDWAMEKNDPRQSPLQTQVLELIENYEKFEPDSYTEMFPPTDYISTKALEWQNNPPDRYYKVSADSPELSSERSLEGSPKEESLILEEEMKEIELGEKEEKRDEDQAGLEEPEGLLQLEEAKKKTPQELEEIALREWRRRQSLDPADRRRIAAEAREEKREMERESGLLRGQRATVGAELEERDYGPPLDDRRIAMETTEENGEREWEYSLLPGRRATLGAELEQREYDPLFEPDEKPTDILAQDIKDISETTTPDAIEPDTIEIWKPNQQDPKSRSETFSPLPPNLAASLQKDINSEWTPHKWNELNLYRSVAAAVESAVLGHLHRSELKLTDIQSLAIPILTKLDNENFHVDPRDHPELRQSFLLAAETGTGKTLAYLAPLLNKLKREEAWGNDHPDHPRNINEIHRPANPRALILCPTSELAEQTYGVLKKLCHEVKFRAGALLPKYTTRVIKKSFLSGQPLDILVATPARLLEFIEAGDIRTKQLSYLIIDEADTLFDRGFLSEVTRIIGSTRHQLTHLVLVSATIPMALERHLRQHFPEMQRIVTPKIHSVPRRLDFSISIEEDKLVGLYKLLTAVQEGDTQRDSDVKRAIVFCNHRDRVKEVYDFLVQQQGFAVDSGKEAVLQLIPFTRENYDRHTALARFKAEMRDWETNTDPENGTTDHSRNKWRDAGNDVSGGRKKLRVLITTDMGSRGLDTISAKLVILYDVPFSNIDLIHRLGRTARAGTRGRAVMLLSTKEAKGTVRTWINDVRDKIIRGQALV